ncbi:DUF3090 family protein [Tessaracoccus coleopterorum]|uniref:DUF3090 family protein n=1 Tax=Tessaracoccus coleopterorum TaxID=2714950 RepID=UPI001E5E71EB|nr:DUF3090 family protein [Tessaracoccus coleopterorum]
MMLEFDRPDRCVVGTVGQPGNRLFLIQVAQGVNWPPSPSRSSRPNSSGPGRRGARPTRRARPRRTAARRPRRHGAAGRPVNVDFRAAAIGLAWDADTGRLVLELFSIEAEDDSGENSLLQVRLTPAMAREFSGRAERVVASGRPACPACGQPLDPGGHICPRANGYRGDLFS